MTSTKLPCTARSRLYQVNHGHLAPPTIVAAFSGEHAITLAWQHIALGNEPSSAIAVDITGEFEALSPIAREHTATLLSARKSGVVEYDDEDGWLVIEAPAIGRDQPSASRNQTLH